MGIGTLGDFVVSGQPRRKHRIGGEGGTSLAPFLWRPICVSLFLILLAGLFRAQIFQGTYFRALADGNRVRKIVIHASRGTIYDRNGVALTVNLPSYRLKSCQDVGGCETQLISKEQAIGLQASGLKEGQSLELDSARNYPYGPVTAHLLGYVSQISAEELHFQTGYSSGDVIGRGGLEEEYEGLLRGKNGEEIIEVDAMGKKLRTLSTVPPVAGKDIATGIDISVQKTAYEALKDVRGAAVATNPQTGEVIALVSTPSFDPNVFTDWSLSPDYRANKISAVLSDASHPLFDRAISGTYPAGSTFKIVTATAGLETGKITESTQITDPGILIIGPYKFPNWLYLRGGGTQGTLNVVGAIAKSNDVFFYRVGEWVGVDDLVNWSKKFGLAAKLGIDLPSEAAGNLPKNSPSWYLGDTYHLAIGQGDLLVTPLQVNRWTSVIGSGGKICQPFVYGKSNCRDMGLSKKTIDLVKDGLVAACSPGGTAWPLFNFNPQVACKTGTAEFGDPKDRTHAWLTAYAPVDKPNIVVTVLVEAGGEGDTVAAPIVKKILEAWFNR